jgi:hypothetical protein
MRDIKALTGIEFLVSPKEDTAKQVEMLGAFLPDFFKANFFSTDSPVVVAVADLKEKEIRFYPLKDNAYIHVKSKAGEDHWNRRYLPGKAVATSIEKMKYVVYNSNAPLFGTELKTTPTGDIARKYHHLD